MMKPDHASGPTAEGAGPWGPAPEPGAIAAHAASDDGVRRPVAYLSMEVAFEPGMPTYSGGLGVLAGDTLRAAADLHVPVVGVTLAHRQGYFHQRLDAEGGQTALPDEWSPEARLEPVDARTEIRLDGRTVHLRAWRYTFHGYDGFAVPVYLLDTDVPENADEDRALTGRLYGGDDRYRLRQEAVLGLGGDAILRAAGHEELDVVHMNEGHSALIGLALLEAAMRAEGVDGPTDETVEAVRRRCVFTTHTPVPAGHDRFPMSLVRRTLGDARAATLEAAGCVDGDTLNMTHVALQFSSYLNGVAMRHREVSRGMFPEYPIDAITNGVHARTWTSPPFRALFDRHIPEWREDPFYLRYAIGIPPAELRRAHEAAKRALLEEIARRTGVRLDPAALTLGFARRATPYKRATLLFTDIDRLRRIARDVGAIQVVYAGKAHPQDVAGQEMIRGVFRAAAALGDDVRVVYLEDYDLALGALMTAGVDVWLNTPRKPQEASGTSGMKAALNGVPSLSVLDGWWVEGHVEGVTGWAIGGGVAAEPDPVRESASLYDRLENEVVPTYYERPDAFTRIIRSAIVLNGSFFHAQRMMLQYARHAYVLRGWTEPAAPVDAAATMPYQ